MNVDLLVRLFDEGPMPVVRTAFASEDAWRRVVELTTADADDGYEPNIEPVSDSSFAGVTGASLAANWPDDAFGYAILADERSMTEALAGAEVTVVLVDLSVDEADAADFGAVVGREFRCTAGKVASIEANLSIANMDFAEFADAVAADGVFRGFAG